MDENLRRLENAWKSSGDEDDLLAYAVAFQRTDPSVSLPGQIPEEIDNWDWSEAFKYAEKPTKAAPCTSVDYQKIAPGFTQEGVKRVITSEAGSNDVDPWYCVVELWDGRFAYLEASCDYTGWG